jgi:hypothetical protein
MFLKNRKNDKNIICNLQHGKNGVRETEDIRNMIICKLMFNKDQRISVGVYQNDIGVLMTKGCKVHGGTGTGDSAKKEVIWLIYLFHISVPLSVHYSLLISLIPLI